MNKQESFEKLDEIAEYKDGWSSWGKGKAFSSLLIERCRRMAEQMNVAPKVMPTVEDSICFQYDCDIMNFEIGIYDDRISGFVSRDFEEASYFEFETESDAVNFWNLVVGEVAKLT